MNTVPTREMTEAEKIQHDAESEIAKERGEHAKNILKGLYRKRDAAKKVVVHIEKEIADALAAIGEGTLI